MADFSPERDNWQMFHLKIHLKETVGSFFFFFSFFQLKTAAMYAVFIQTVCRQCMFFGVLKKMYVEACFSNEIMLITSPLVVFRENFETPK